MKTRVDYMNNLINHVDYYSQYVNQRIVNIVAAWIGVDKIVNSNDPHFNDINLAEWDSLYAVVNSATSRHLLKLAGETMSLCTAVCIAKAAANQIVVEHCS
jgi:hypothetical protein